MANYRIFRDGNEINTIVADEAFCSEYCEKNGYTYELMPEEPEIVEVEPTTEERVTALEETTTQQGEILNILLSGETEESV